jgi:hypothetical protein
MCRLCETKPVYEFTNKRKLCKTCFIHWFEKKFLYTIRKFKMIDKGDIILVEDKKDFRGVVLKKLMEIFSERAPVKVVGSGKFTSKAIALTSDTEAEKIIQTLFNGKEKDLKNFLPTENKIIKPMYLFLDKEVLLYAKLKNLKFKKIKEKKDKLIYFLEDLEKKHPELKHSIINSELEIYS